MYGSSISNGVGPMGLKGIVRDLTTDVLKEERHGEESVGHANEE
ncbi:MAG: hypothetical protein ACI8X5_001213 [Planctomycetota bacterium]|jgi:hypothetical protein